jgi:glycosyltransferase involved in cell wall biosynthesis
MLHAWAANPHALPLKIAGDGPLRPLVEERAALLSNVEYLGRCEHAHVVSMLRDAALLMFPSRWYEGMPMILLEAMACGTPVVAFAVGSLNELIIDFENGCKLPLGGNDALSDLLKDRGRLETITSLRAGARAYFERHFTAGRNYRLLLDAYQNALDGLTR